MSIPLLEWTPLSQNHRVNGFEVPGDEQPRIYNAKNLLSTSDLDDLITAAYRQIYNEQQMLNHHRQHFLESQLRAGQITVKDFIRSLVLSDSFRRLTYECNNNYRFVEICVQRVLGRNVYGDREKIARSIVLATKGLQGFIDELLDSEEYESNFGDNMFRINVAGSYLNRIKEKSPLPTPRAMEQIIGTSYLNPTCGEFSYFNKMRMAYSLKVSSLIGKSL